MKRFTLPAILVVAICGTLSTAHAKQNSNGTFTVLQPYAQASSGTVVLFSTDQMTSDAVCKLIDRDRPFSIHSSEFGLVDHVFGDKSTAIAAFVAGARVLITEEQNKPTQSKIKTITCSSERPMVYF